MWGSARAARHLIALLDDDDEWAPDKLSRQLEAAWNSEKKYPVITCRLIARRPEGDEMWPARAIRPGESMSEYLLCREASIRQGEGFIQTSTMLAPRALMLEVPFTSNLPRHQDWDWLIRASVHPGVEFLWVWEALVIYHIDAYRKSVSAGRSLAPVFELDQWQSACNSQGEGLLLRHANCGPVPNSSSSRFDRDEYFALSTRVVDCHGPCAGAAEPGLPASFQERPQPCVRYLSLSQRWVNGQTTCARSCVP